MEAIITQPHLPSDAHPLTRLLAAIVAFLQALLAAHQSGQLPARAPASPRRRTRTQKPNKTATFRRRPARTRTHALKIQPQPRAYAAMPPCAQPRPRDMTAGLPRPRLVGPH